MKTFYQLFLNNIISTITVNFVWFALIFWGYLVTESVLFTSFCGGVFLAANALSSFWFGALVDNHKKKPVLIIANIFTLIMFTICFFIFLSTPEESFKNINSPELWFLTITLLLGVVAGGVRYIAIPTLVTVLVPEDKRDRANGLMGTSMGIAMSINSVASGLILAFGGMKTIFIVGIILMTITLIHLALINIPEKQIIHTEDKQNKIDIKGTIKLIRSLPGLFPLIFFTMFNNFLGGVFMSLMDAYGLELVSVEVWGALWGVLSLGFIVGGLIIAKRGLGKNPVRTLFIANICMWISAMFFTIQPSIILLSVGVAIWITIFPFIEASEQTIIQKIVPLERQGRVFGFAHTIEQAASPLTAFIIGPIAQLIFIPFMTSGAGVELIGHWYGTGPDRGMALVFSLAGVIGLIITLLAMGSRFNKELSKQYLSK